MGVPDIGPFHSCWRCCLCRPSFRRYSCSLPSLLAAVGGRLGVVLGVAGSAGAPAHQHALAFSHELGSGHHPAQIVSTFPYAQSGGPPPIPALPTLAAFSTAPTTATPVQVAQV